MAQQLVKKSNGGYENVMPKSWIDAIVDKSTGKTLTDILQSFNMYFLSYSGNTMETRCQVPSSIRKKGLWITYVKYDGKVYTEWYAASTIDDKSWGDSSNWRVANNTLVGDISISANGNWVINGDETAHKAVGERGDTPMLRVYDNKLQVSYDEGDTWTNVTENPVYTKFRWFAETPNIGRIQASTDGGATWVDMSNNFTNNLKIKRYIGADETLPTSGIQEGDIYAKGPFYDASDTSHQYPTYRLCVYAWKGNTLAWQDNGEFQSIAAGIVQETGNNENTVMSQAAVTKELSELGSEVLNNYFVGKGEKYNSTRIDGLIPGHSYRIFLRNNWEDSTDNTSGYKFLVESYDKDDNITQLSGWKIGSSIPQYRDITIPADSAYIRIGGRANSGVKVWFYIEDLWLKKVTDSYGGISLVNTSGFIPNIDTSSLTLDLGTDPVLLVGTKTYTLSSNYRNIRLYSDTSKSSALALVVNIDTSNIYVKPYSSDREPSEIVIGGIRLHYDNTDSKFTFKSANMPFNFTIDGFEVDDLVSRSYIIGDGNTFSRRNLRGLIQGRTYKLSLQNTKWDRSGVTVTDSGYTLFGISSYKNDNETSLKEVKITATETLKYYTFTVPEECDYISIGCRATRGEKVWFTIEDVTDIDELRRDSYTNYFVGVGSNFVSTKVESLVPNQIYKIFFKKDWEDSTDNTKAMKLSVESYDSEGNATSLGGWKIGVATPEFIEVTVPSNSEYVTIGGRALYNEKVWFTIAHIRASDEILFNGISLINSVGFTPNIDTENLTLDLGSDPIFAVGNTSYALTSIHSESSVYRNISLPAEGSTSGALVVVFNIETKKIYSKQYKEKRKPNEIIIGGVRLHYSSSAQKFIFKSANFIFDFTVDGATAPDTDTDTDTSVIGLNGGLSELTSKFIDLSKRKGISGNGNYGNKICNIIFTSDAHNGTVYLSRIVSFKSSFKDYITDILHGGDGVKDQFVNDNPFANIEGGEYILNTIGNHDNWDSSNVTGEAIDGRVPQKMVYDKFISPYISNWGDELNPITQPSGASEYGYCYYCKDYTESKVRLIVLDCMNYNDHQNSWLSDILDDAINKEYHVIICNHYTPGKSYTPDYSCTFSSIYDNGYSVTKECISANASATVQAKIDNGLKFVCWLFGHYHRDFFGSLTDYPKQFGLAVDKTSPGSGWERDSCRSGNGREQDAFNVISVDTSHGIMTVMRIGNNRDKFMRQKNYLTFDYINSKIIHNS